MAATTFPAFRAEMVTLIEAISPTTVLHANRTPAFKFADDEVDFRAWVPANPGACTRYFTIYDLFDDDPLEISDDVSELQKVRCEVLVAYQHDYKYGSAKIRNRQDIIRQDWWSIRSTLGIPGRSNYTNGCTVEESSTRFSVEQDDSVGVSVLVIPFLVRFFQSL